MTANEKQAFFRYYCELGRHMGIQAIPTDYAEFEQFNLAYERDYFKFAPSNRRIGDATVNLLLGMYAPKLLWPLLRPSAYALMDEPLLVAFGFPYPPHWLRRLLNTLLYLRARVLAVLPERTQPWPGTKRKRPTYPEGYEIEELGTFKVGG